MSICTVADLRNTLGVGTLYSDSELQDVCDATDSALIPLLWANKNYNIGHSNTTTTGTLYFQDSVIGTYYVGQTVNISGNGSKHNGNKTITGVDTYSITYAVTGSPTAAPYHPVLPFGIVSADTYVDWTTDAAIIQAALMIAVDIWQARQVTSSGGSAIDMVSPSPWRMGNGLMGKVRGLIAHALDPKMMVG